MKRRPERCDGTCFYFLHNKICARGTYLGHGIERAPAFLPRYTPPEPVRDRQPVVFYNRCLRNKLRAAATRITEVVPISHTMPAMFIRAERFSRIGWLPRPFVITIFPFGGFVWGGEEEGTTGASARIGIPDRELHFRSVSSRRTGHFAHISYCTEFFYRFLFNYFFFFYTEAVWSFFFSTATAPAVRKKRVRERERNTHRIVTWILRYCGTSSRARYKIVKKK